MCILDGNAYDAKCLEAGQERDKDLDACSLYCNNKGQPLLAPTGIAAHNSESKVVVQLAVSAIVLNPIKFLVSCESALFVPSQVIRFAVLIIVLEVLRHSAAVCKWPMPSPHLWATPRLPGQLTKTLVRIAACKSQFRETFL